MKKKIYSRSRFKRTPTEAGSPQTWPLPPCADLIRDCLMSAVLIDLENYDKDECVWTLRRAVKLLKVMVGRGYKYDCDPELVDECYYVFLWLYRKERRKWLEGQVT